MRLSKLLWISLLLCGLPLWLQAQKRYSRTFSQDGKFYHYIFEPSSKAPDLWNFTLSTVQHSKATGEVESNKIYSSDAYISGDSRRISHVRIYAATPLDYSWAVSYTHFYEAEFQWSTGKIEYAYSGNRMERAFTPFEKSAEISRFNVATTTPDDAVRIAVQQFVLRYAKLFRYPDMPEKLPHTISGRVIFNNEVYDYEIRRDFFNPGDDNLSIRKQGNGLVFNTLMQTELTPEQLQVKIHYVQQRGLAWSVFANDYLTARFALKQGHISWEKIGSDMPVNAEPPQPQMSFAANTPAEKLLHIAVEHLIQQYSAAFSR
ncbi:hypothetical protein [Rhodoflexus caldus]|uniref:hypothetical protein n=1 Tax=Rhodoflexus caldus TaxID=2891236 RepID=UPI00202A2A78|nr:hypothetical protein [Rhodoflexus caldus]